MNETSMNENMGLTEETMRPELYTFTNEMNSLMNDVWMELCKKIETNTVIVSMGFVVDPERADEILSSYIANYTGGINIVGTVTSCVDAGDGTIAFQEENEGVFANITYFYKGSHFVPRCYPGHMADALNDGEVLEWFDHVPDLLELLEVAIKHDTATPVIGIDQENHNVEINSCDCCEDEDMEFLNS